MPRGLSRPVAPPAIEARARPSSVAPVPSEIAWLAMMVPWKAVPVPSVAEVPTCQNTFAALAPPVRMTCRPAVVVNVEAIWKMNTALGSPSRATSAV